MNHPRISIVIPSLNQGEYLEQAILSVLSQDYLDLELIVIDGGSQDTSLNIIRKYANQIAYWISESDCGQSHAINKGFAKCTGDIVTFLSSDDTYVSGALIDVGTKFNASKTLNLGAIVGAFQMQDEKSNIVTNPILPLIPYTGPIDLTLVHPSQYRLHQVSTFFTRTALEKVGFMVKEELRYVMDRELLYRVCREYSVLLVDRVYGVFRKHDLSKSEYSILPFAEEFARLYLESTTGEPSKDRLRTRNAKYFYASGWLKYAKATGDIWHAIPSLLRALYLRPNYLFQYSYLASWRHVIVKWITRYWNK
jgi:glycosyltransferase involved in cell wall biosynthesis